MATKPVKPRRANDDAGSGRGMELDEVQGDDEGGCGRVVMIAATVLLVILVMEVVATAVVIFEVAAGNRIM